MRHRIGGRIPPPRDLTERAEKETGLSDFGAEGFREGLEILVDSLNSEARLNALGESALTQRILLHLKQRLEIEAWYRRHPEIEDEEIRNPLFGVSLPRTGSSALSFLLASDPAVRYLRVWESSRPCPPPGTVEGPDPRRGVSASSADEQLKGGTRTPTGIDGAMECQDLMALDFRSQIFQAFAQIPRYSEWLLQADLSGTYAYHKRVLKLLQWRQPRRPWRLKAPTHLLYLDALVATYPDARFVMTHRDPGEVILSVAAVYADIAGKFSDALDHAWLGELNLRTWSEAMRRGIAFRDAGGDPRFHDIHFRAMLADPIGQVRELYAWLGEPISPPFARSMADWWQSNENAQRMPRPDAALFALDPDAVRQHFSEYRARMERWAPFGEAA